MDYIHKLFQHLSYYHHLYNNTFSLKNIDLCAIIIWVVVIMTIKLDKLILQSYDNKNEQHRNFKYSILRDESFNKFFGQMFIKNSDEYFKETDNLEVKKIYLIQDEENIIGMIRLFDKNNFDIINLQYAVAPEFRNMGYGKKILKEISEYFKNYTIDLDINKNNIPSINCAIDSGFTNYKQENEEIRYRRKS